MSSISKRKGQGRECNVLTCEDGRLGDEVRKTKEWKNKRIWNYKRVKSL